MSDHSEEQTDTDHYLMAAELIDRERETK